MGNWESRSCTDPASLIGCRVDVYRNLQRECWSVRYKGRVVLHCTTLTLTAVTFKVSEAGRQRVLLERQKNVHAVVRGTLVTYGGRRGLGTQRVTYNPYRRGCFTDIWGYPVYQADVVDMHDGYAWVR